jgi:hypothetical protein
MGELILSKRFVNGQEITNHELREVYKRINGKDLPRTARPSDVAHHFVKTRPERFEFEVNRLRGFAWDNGVNP